MGRYHSCNKQGLAWIGILAVFVPFTFLCNSAHALTASIGQPYHGRLVNGVPFPTQFRGYHLRDTDRTYTTPEVIGAVLDAVDAVQKQYPTTCDLYFGDFSTPEGGSASHHRSHQNGRDVDIGMYFRDNRPVDTFMPMNEANLDVSKTWCFVEGLLRTQRIQYIFLDRRVQKLLYDYALSRGVDETYLNRLFGNSKGAIVQHVVNHQDHMHVRFYTPWSTLASRVGELDTQKRLVIEMAQQAYLPKKVNYYVQGTESGMDALAQSFGVNRRDLYRWNQMSPSEVMTPGSCLVFYKRGFELEPVHVAQSLRADLIPSYRLASFRSSRTLMDAPVSLPAPPKSLEPATEKKVAPPAVQTYVVKKGDTLASIARENSMDVKTLCDMNRLKPTSSLMLGRKLQVTSAKFAAQPVDVPSSTVQIPPRRESASTCRQEKAPSGTTHRVATGDTLQSISKKYGIGVGDLCRSNDITKGAALKRGQKIVVSRVEDSPKDNSRSAQPRGALLPSNAGSKSAELVKAAPSPSSPASKQVATGGKTASSKANSKLPAQVQKSPVAKKDATKDKPVQEGKNGKQQEKSAKLDVKKRTN